MNNLMVILLILFVALLVVVPLLERFASKTSAESAPRLGRWILPLVMVLLILQLLRHWLGK
ncbi:MAG: hypothetical protein GYB33_04095 [Gammaproteobacteria bacterium]|uniref:hypothetical protein n=1 Tax=Pseudomaricurvus alcaniphilus TaxID=1166482 RepID=UPI0014099E72|nr:hypothetical protein [Pseudomaricurvus alcaniphilus]MBR9909520.1 hypothetical protein [Gammaproteobacteria bacterium]NHN37066.1 hypothetical protein [Pseudomaricurvus alcaniphilus]